MRINKYIFILFYIFSVSLYSQVIEDEVKEGRVTFSSSQFIYVNFQNTNGISEGDTLFSKNKNTFVPVLKVVHLSSTSAACEKIGDIKIDQGMTIIFKKQITNENISKIDSSRSNESIINTSQVGEITVVNNKTVKSSSSRFRGRYSIQSYSGLSNLNSNTDFQRWRHSLLLGIKNIAGSGLSFSTYTNFTYNVEKWQEVSSNLGKAIKVYDLNLNYQFTESAQFKLGRFLNPKISNISVVDGAQFEKAFSFLTVGLVAGSRPNFYDFGLNLKLFEYGIYLSRSDTVGNRLMENTLSYFEQTNDFKTDRRFVYFQHYNNLLKTLSLFASSEVDLYKVTGGIQKNDFSLTSLYLSARYAPVNEVSFNVSYDARKNIIYYETFKSIADSILENETRQGLRVRTYLRPWQNLFASLQFGYRTVKSDVKPSKNYGGSLGYNSLPLLDASVMVDFNKLSSNYVDGYIYTANLSKYLYNLRSDFSIGFRKTNYSFTNSDYKLDENAILINFSTSILSPFSFSISYEGAFESVRTYNRILIDLTTRF